MPILKYKILSPILALVPDGGRNVARTVPIGSIISMESGEFDRNRLVAATWDGQDVMIFAQDVRSRGEKVE